MLKFSLDCDCVSQVEVARADVTELNCYTDAIVHYIRIQGYVGKNSKIDDYFIVQIVVFLQEIHIYIYNKGKEKDTHVL